MKAIVSVPLSLCLMTSFPLSSYSKTRSTTVAYYAVDSTRPGMIIMPVTYINMRAYENGSGVFIAWSNLTEQNLDHYMVERSTDGNVFKPLDQIGVKNNNHLQADYDCYDRMPNNKLNFYRIKAVGLDGEVTYSRALRVEMNSKDKKVALYPNPVAGRQLSVQMTGLDKGDYTIHIFSKIGTTLYTKELHYQGGSMTETIDLPISVRQGIYNLNVRGEKGYETSQLFIVP